MRMIGQRLGEMSSFFISDTHFSHKGIVTFEHEGKPLRPFKTVEEMDETLVNNWNSVVNAGDTVYHLGDVVINRRALPILNLLHGRKVLIKGNHDIFPLKDWLPYFDDIRAYKVMPEYGVICSHIPIHPDCMSRWRANIHGHLHANLIKDSRYISVCCEQINYTPIRLEEVLKRVP